MDQRRRRRLGRGVYENCFSVFAPFGEPPKIEFFRVPKGESREPGHLSSEAVFQSDAGAEGVRLRRRSGNCFM